MCYSKQVNNKKGFTLVELLAVIVILALIMSIAIVSMSGIMDSARKSTFKETAVQIISGVRQRLTLAGELIPDNFPESKPYKIYFFTSDILDKGGKTSPMGGDIAYVTPIEYNGNTCTSSDGLVNFTSHTDGYDYCAYIGLSYSTKLKKIGSTGLYEAYNPYSCYDAYKSYVRVKYNTSLNNFEYSICMTAGEGNYYIKDTNGSSATASSQSTEEKLLESNNFDMIVK